MHIEQNKHDPKIIVALDFHSIADVNALVAQLNPNLCRLKIGKTLFTHYGPDLVEDLIKQGFSVFLDLKFHDIPKQVAGACKAAAELGVWMISVHIQGGFTMLHTAATELQQYPQASRPHLIGITVLTSLEERDLEMLAVNEPIKLLVPRLAKLAKKAGLDGVVCSAQEAELLRRSINQPFLLVTPGIRLTDDSKNDQKRIMLPQQAIAAGADYLVIGRSITQAKNPLKVLERITEEINKITLNMRT